MSTSRVTKVTPCATAANPPTRTNSTCASISRRVSSLRFCISFVHRGAERICETQRIIIGLHPLPRCFCQAILKQRNVNFTVRGGAARRDGFPRSRAVFPGFYPEFISARLHVRKVTPRPVAVKLGPPEMGSTITLPIIVDEADRRRAGWGQDAAPTASGICRGDLPRLEPSGSPGGHLPG